MITIEDITSRLVNQRSSLKFRSVELIGDEKSFGKIVIDGWFHLSIFTHNENQIMDCLEELMLCPVKHMEAAIDKKIELNS